MPPVSITFSGDTLSAALAAARAAVSVDQVPQTEAPAAAPAAAPKARTRARPPEGEPSAAPAPAAAPAAAAAPVADTANLKKIAISKLVTLINANDALGRNGKQVCTDLCNKFGGRNISAISADKYPAVIAEVDKALAALSEDPTA